MTTQDYNKAIETGKKLVENGMKVSKIRETLESEFQSIETRNTTTDFGKSDMAKVMDAICEFKESLS